MEPVDPCYSRPSFWRRWLHDPGWNPVDKVLFALGLVLFVGFAFVILVLDEMLGVPPPW